MKQEMADEIQALLKFNESQFKHLEASYFDMRATIERLERCSTCEHNNVKHEKKNAFMAESYVCKDCGYVMEAL